MNVFLRLTLNSSAVFAQYFSAVFRIFLKWHSRCSQNHLYYFNHDEWLICVKNMCETLFNNKSQRNFCIYNCWAHFQYKTPHWSVVMKQKGRRRMLVLSVWELTRNYLNGIFSHIKWMMCMCVFVHERTRSFSLHFFSNTHQSVGWWSACIFRVISSLWKNCQSHIRIINGNFCILTQHPREMYWVGVIIIFVYANILATESPTNQTNSIANYKYSNKRIRSWNCFRPQWSYMWEYPLTIPLKLCSDRERLGDVQNIMIRSTLYVSLLVELCVSGKRGSFDNTGLWTTWWHFSNETYH